MTEDKRKSGKIKKLVIRTISAVAFLGALGIDSIVDKVDEAINAPKIAEKKAEVIKDKLTYKKAKEIFATAIVNKMSNLQRTGIDDLVEITSLSRSEAYAEAKETKIPKDTVAVVGFELQKMARDFQSSVNLSGADKLKAYQEQLNAYMEKGQPQTLDKHRSVESVNKNYIAQHGSYTR